MYTLETITPMPNHFTWLTDPYTVIIQYTLSDDIIDIHSASLLPQNCRMPNLISHYLHGEIARHYDAELRAQAARYIPQTSNHEAEK